MPLDESVRRETRCIRDIQVVHADPLPLDSSGNKIPGTTLDAFAAFLQDNSDDPDWCIFSSRLGLLVPGVVKESQTNGTVKGCVEAAVSNIESKDK